MNLDKINFDNIPYTKEQVKEWYEEHKDVVRKSDRVWIDLLPQVISAVETPAQDSEFIEVKSNEKIEEFDYLKSEKEDEEMISYAAVMTPNIKDKDGDVIPDFVVREAAHRFMAEKRNKDVDEAHESRFSDHSIKTRGTVIESWTLDEPEEFETINNNKKRYPENTWMAKIKFEDEDVWSKIKAGEITGYSIQGEPEVIDLDEEKYIKGDNKDSNMTEDKNTDGVTVTVEQDQLVDTIATQISEQVELEPETKEVEVVPDFDEYTEEIEVKEINTQDLIGLVADHFEVEASEVSDALENIGGESEEEQETESEDEETEETKEVNRNASEENQSEDESETKQADEDDFSDLWDF